MRNLLQLVVLGALCGFLTGCRSRQEAKRDGAVPSVVDAAQSPCGVLADRLCANFGKGSEMCAFVEREAQRLRAQFCQSKLDRFDENVAELYRYQEARTLIAVPAQKSRTVEVPATGLRNAPVVLTVFCDFAVPDCGRLSPLHNFVKSLYGDKLRLVYRQFPLVKNRDARLAAEASLAANAQGKFWEYYDVLFSNQHDQSRAALERYAKAAGLELSEFNKALDNHVYFSDVDADKALGKSLFISELPAVFANGRSVAPPYAVAELTQVVEEAIAKRGPTP